MMSFIINFIKRSDLTKTLYSALQAFGFFVEYSCSRSQSWEYKNYSRYSLYDSLYVDRFNNGNDNTQF